MPHSHKNEDADSHSLIKRRRFIKVVNRLSESFFTGIIFAIIASLLTTSIMEYISTQKEIDSKIENVSNIYIGCNKSWADEKFGTPQFSSEKDEFLLCAYISEFYVIQIAYDKSNSAQAFLVTALENDKNQKIVINDKTIVNDSPIELCEFSFYDFPGDPLSVFGFITNGTGRELYSEFYYFGGIGAHYEYYIATLDYGNKFETADFGMISEGEKIDDEVDFQKNLGVQIVTNRKTCYPNTYGVSNGNIDMYEMMFDYSWFNSQQLRNQYRHLTP